MHKKIAYKTFLPVKWFLPAVFLFLFSCKNEDTKVPDAVKDSVAASGNGISAGSHSKPGDTTASGLSVNSGVGSKDSATHSTAPVKTIADKTKTGKAALTGKIIAAHTDSLGAAAKGIVQAPNPATAAPAQPVAADNTKTESPDHVFVPKYGIIPRNTTDNNITAFVNAFPDKNTSIRINFDGDADAEMQGVKAQILKVLKSRGYVNVSDKSISLNPIRMPKEIHYELQRDESVVIWVPVANTQQ